jgi:hypothetical protein
MTCRILSLLLLAFIPAFSADRIPKVMKPKLIKDGTVLFTDNFDAAALDAAWRKPTGDGAGKVEIVEGTAHIDSGAGRQGAIWRPMPEGTENVGVQALMKPFAVNWMGVRFMTRGETEAKQWRIAAIIYATGFVRVVVPDKDGAGLKILKSAKVKLGAEDWWRVSVESKGDDYLVRVNGDEVIQVRAKEAEGPKNGVMLNLYGGKGAADEIEVTAAAKK